ncbi:MAG TPA: GNAT family N-acetyltransferase [Mycobacteriales bacterium]|nr:GNAT family N-acetyltransferase [Mycobacteriales bacterium]
MPRGNVRIRPAELADVDVLAELAAEYRASVGGHTYRVARRTGGPAGDTHARYLRLLEDARHRVVVAADEGSGTVLGMAVFGLDVVSTLADVPSVYVGNLLVAPRHRHRGAGRALLAAAVSYADELGVDHVIVGVAAGGREANRFLARLGFAPLVLRRVAPVSALRRTLGLVDSLGDGRMHVPRRRLPGRAGLPPSARAARLRRLP